VDFSSGFKNAFGNQRLSGAVEILVFVRVAVAPKEHIFSLHPQSAPSVQPLRGQPSFQWSQFI